MSDSAPFFSSHFNLKSSLFFNILLFGIIPVIMGLPDYKTMLSVSHGKAHSQLVLFGAIVFLLLIEGDT